MGGDTNCSAVDATVNNDDGERMRRNKKRFVGRNTSSSDSDGDDAVERKKICFSVGEQSALSKVGRTDRVSNGGRPKNSKDTVKRQPRACGRCRDNHKQG